MKLGLPPGRYDARHEQDRNRQLEMADRKNHKRGQDVEIGAARLVLTSPDGARWSVTVDNLGVLSAVAI